MKRKTFATMVFLDKGIFTMKNVCHIMEKVWLVCLYFFQLVHAAEISRTCQTATGCHVIQMGTATYIHAHIICPVQKDILPIEQNQSRSPAIPTETGLHLQGIVKVVLFGLLLFFLVNSEM